MKMAAEEEFAGALDNRIYPQLLNGGWGFLLTKRKERLLGCAQIINSAPGETR